MQVGDILKKVLHDTWGVPHCGACHETAKRMNELGPQGCRDHLDELAEQLHQNAKDMTKVKLRGGWHKFKAAAVTYADKGLHIVTGNSLYRSVIIKAVEYVEKHNEVCSFRGPRAGHTAWKAPRFRCTNPEVHETFCVVVATDIERRRSKPDNTAVCDGCIHTTKEI